MHVPKLFMIHWTSMKNIAFKLGYVKLKIYFFFFLTCYILIQIIICTISVPKRKKHHSFSTESTADCYFYSSSWTGMHLYDSMSSEFAGFPWRLQAGMPSQQAQRGRHSILFLDRSPSSWQRVSPTLSSRKSPQRDMFMEFSRSGVHCLGYNAGTDWSQTPRSNARVGCPLTGRRPDR